MIRVIIFAIALRFLMWDLECKLKNPPMSLQTLLEMKTVRLYTVVFFSDDYFILFRGALRPSLRARRSFDPKLRERQESSRPCSSRENRGSLAYRKRALLFKSLLFPHGSDLNISLSPSFDSCQLVCNEAPSCWNRLRELQERRV